MMGKPNPTATPPHSKSTAMKLNEYAALSPIIARARLIRLYDMLLQEALPNDLTGRVEVLNIRDGVLVLGAGNAAIATRVRYQQANWLEAINRARLKWSGLPVVTGLTVRVHASGPARRPKPHRARPTEAIGQALRQLGAEDQDPRFRRVMERLASLSDTRDEPDRN